MNLDYNATLEKIEENFNAQIKKIDLKNKKSSKRLIKKRNRIVNCYDAIKKFVAEFGTDHKPMLSISLSSLVIQFMLLGLLIMLFAKSMSLLV